MSAVKIDPTLSDRLYLGGVSDPAEALDLVRRLCEQEERWAAGVGDPYGPDSPVSVLKAAAAHAAGVLAQELAAARSRTACRLLGTAAALGDEGRGLPGEADCCRELALAVESGDWSSLAL